MCSLHLMGLPRSWGHDKYAFVVVPSGVFSEAYPALSQHCMICMAFSSRLSMTVCPWSAFALFIESLLHRHLHLCSHMAVGGALCQQRQAKGIFDSATAQEGPC